MQSESHTVQEPESPEVARLLDRIADLERERPGLERFAAAAAHELLTPVIMIDAYAVMICERLDPDLDADSLRDLDALRRVAARSRALAEAMLHHARSPELQRRTVELDDVLRESLALLAPEIRSRGVEIQVGDLPRLSVEEAMIGAVFTNLLMNALKYGPREAPRISVRAARESAGWRVLVESTGPPIAAQDRDRIFAPYQRGEGERRARGSGLGLAICREIVERHGGRLGLDVLDGRNAFSFTLPDPAPADG